MLGKKFLPWRDEGTEDNYRQTTGSIAQNTWYEATRQTGSHIRLTTHQHGQHHITIPNHDPIKIGTLSAILNDVAHHFKMPKEELLKLLYK